MPYGLAVIVGTIIYVCMFVHIYVCISHEEAMIGCMYGGMTGMKCISAYMYVCMVMVGVRGRVPMTSGYTHR